jgi:hypothetical protein
MSGTDAPRTDFDAAHGSLLDSFDFLQVGVPNSPGFVVGMADIVTEAGPFAADCTYF